MLRFASHLVPDATATDGDTLSLVRGRPLLCLSDIHGDSTALDAVLHAVKDIELCGIVVAGDHCMGGPDPFGVWQRLLACGAQLVRGATDAALGTLRLRSVTPRSAREEARWVTFLRTQEALGELVCRRLAELPSSLVVSLDDKSGVMVMHGSPSDEYRGLQLDEHFEAEVDAVAEDVLVVGSTHRGFVHRPRADLLVVNAGSVGASPGRNAQGDRTARAVLVASCVDGVVRAFCADVPVALGHEARALDPTAARTA